MCTKGSHQFKITENNVKITTYAHFRRKNHKVGTFVSKFTTYAFFCRENHNIHAHSKITTKRTLVERKKQDFREVGRGGGHHFMNFFSQIPFFLIDGFRTLNADYLSSLVCMRTKSTISISEALQTNFCRGRIGSIKVLQNFDQNHLISLPPPPPPPLIVEQAIGPIFFTQKFWVFLREAPKSFTRCLFGHCPNSDCTHTPPAAHKRALWGIFLRVLTPKQRVPQAILASVQTPVSFSYFSIL